LYDQVDRTLRRLHDDQPKLAAAHLVQHVGDGREGGMAEVKADLEKAAAVPLHLGHLIFVAVAPV
jgi:hypothetical protein